MPGTAPGTAQARVEEALAFRWAAGAIGALAEQNVINQIRIAEEGGLAPLVEMLKRPAMALPAESGRASAAPTTSWDAPTFALWHLASNADNQLGIARAGGLAPLVRVLAEGSEQGRQWAAAALEALVRECTENQLAFARPVSDAIGPLVLLLGRGGEETQQHAMNALLHIGAPSDANRNAVVRPLVALLHHVRNASATLMATRILAVLAGRSAASCAAIAAEGAIAPLCGLLGDGRNASGLQTRVAEVLFHLCQFAANKEALIGAGGAPPLVQMLIPSAQREAQLHACACLSRIAATTKGQQIIAGAGGVPLLVALLSSETLETARYAAEALWHLGGSKGENKATIVKVGGIVPLVALLRRHESAEAQAFAAGVLADLAKDKGVAKRAIVNVGGVGPLVTLLSLGSASAQKHACCALWGLTQGETTEAAQHKRQLVEAGALAPLIELVRDDGCEAHGQALATLSNLAHDEDARTGMLLANATEPFLAIARRAEPSWLRDQVTTILRLSTSLVRLSTSLIRLSTSLVRLSTSLIRLSASLIRLSASLIRTSASLIRLSASLIRTSASHIRLSASLIRPSASHIRTSASLIRLIACLIRSPPSWRYSTCRPSSMRRSRRAAVRRAAGTMVPETAPS